MERTKLLTVAVIGLLLLNFLVIGFLVLNPNRPPHHDHRNSPPIGEGPANIIIERLHFDVAQQQQYRQLVADHQKQNRRLNETSIRLYRDYYELLKADLPDSAQEKALSQQIADTHRALSQLNFAHFRQIKALCRPDQQTYFNQLVNDLSHLFGGQQRLQPPSDDGPPKNLPPMP